MLLNTDEPALQLGSRLATRLSLRGFAPRLGGYAHRRRRRSRAGGSGASSRDGDMTARAIEEIEATCQGPCKICVHLWRNPCSSDLRR